MIVNKCQSPFYVDMISWFQMNALVESSIDLISQSVWPLSIETTLPLDIMCVLSAHVNVFKRLDIYCLSCFHTFHQLSKVILVLTQVCGEPDDVPEGYDKAMLISRTLGILL